MVRRMRGLTDSESAKIGEIKGRLSMLSSPVLRLQAILQFSQIVDILQIGDTSGVREKQFLAEIDELNIHVECLTESLNESETEFFKAVKALEKAQRAKEPQAKTQAESEHIGFKETT